MKCAVALTGWLTTNVNNAGKRQAKLFGLPSNTFLSSNNKAFKKAAEVLFTDYSDRTQLDAINGMACFVWRWNKLPKMLGMR